MLAAVAATMMALAAPASAGGETELRISVWAEGRGTGAPKVWTLRCDPPGGTLPQSAAACRRLAGLVRPFAPPAKNMQCTQIYGGPAEALIVGRHRGTRVSALLTRRDGCQIARWARVGFLTPGFNSRGPA